MMVAITGLGPFYDGLSHFVLTREDLLPALALALLVGLNGARTGRTTLFGLSAAWLGGGLAGLAWPTVTSVPALTIVSFLVLGAMVAADQRLRLAWPGASAWPCCWAGSTVISTARPWPARGSAWRAWPASCRPCSSP